MRAQKTYRRHVTTWTSLASLMVCWGCSGELTQVDPVDQEDQGLLDAGGEDPLEDMSTLQDMPVVVRDAGAKDVGSVEDAGVDVGQVDQGKEEDLDPGMVSAQDDFVHVRSGEQVVLDLFANDTATRDGALALVQIEEPSRGELSIDGGVVTYAASVRHNGLEVLEYTVDDGSGQEATARVFINTFESFEEGAPSVLVPEPPGLDASQLAVVINTSDPYSVTVGESYAAKRKILPEHVIRVSFDASKSTMSQEEFATLQTELDAKVPAEVQGFALAWLKPYRVDCLTMTTAFALGFDKKYCRSAQESGPCRSTAPVDYFRSYSEDPLTDHGIRPAMMLALTNEPDGEALIDRGVASDGTFPGGKGYLVRTTDVPRSRRYGDFLGLPDAWGDGRGLDLEYIDNSDGSGENLITNATDVLFYFTGLTRVRDLDTNTYLPGAVADHLTSFGGRLDATSGQMSVVRWLEGGVTASYGTAIEPCNFPQKFPRVSVFLDHYYRGETVLEAYWKSVNWPGEGVFIGEPLARPWGRVFLDHSEGDGLTIGLSWLKPRTPYQLQGADDLDGPWEDVGEEVSVSRVEWTELAVPEVTWRYYRLTELDPEPD